MATLTLSGITKVYDDAKGTERAVDDLSLSVDDGEFIVFVGPSGCGKSTTLRMLAGLETVSEGTIGIDGDEVQHLAPSGRNVAMVFQSYALYTKMTAYENMNYGLKHSTNLSKSKREEKVNEAAELLGITDLLSDRPQEMSGGQKQRVALGRAIVRDPDVFLLDEPLSNLDAKLRSRMRTELQRIQNDLGVTTIYVTHDQTEAMTMADRLVVLNDGILQQVASPEEAYNHPTNEFVATFLGSPAMNIFDVTTAIERDTIFFKQGECTFATVPAETVDLRDGETIRLGLRPEDFTIHENLDEGTFTATVLVSEYQGNDNFIHLDAMGELTACVPPDVYPDPDADVGVTIDPHDVYLFDPETGEAVKTRGLNPVDQSSNPSTQSDSQLTDTASN